MVIFFLVFVREIFVREKGCGLRVGVELGGEDFF